MTELSTRASPAIPTTIVPVSTATALLGLGANLGDAVTTLGLACERLADVPGIWVTDRASLYSSAPLDAPGPHYTNTALKIRTTLSPLALLDVLQSVERIFGRVRSFRNAPRTLDIDLLWYDDIEIEVPRLTLPHPRMHLRAFVLLPLVELVGDSFTLREQPVSHWLEACRDQVCIQLTPASGKKS